MKRIKEGNEEIYTTPNNERIEEYYKATREDFTWSFGRLLSSPKVDNVVNYTTLFPIMRSLPLEQKKEWLEDVLKEDGKYTINENTKTFIDKFANFMNEKSLDDAYTKYFDDLGTCNELEIQDWLNTEIFDNLFDEVDKEYDEIHENADLDFAEDIEDINYEDVHDKEKRKAEVLQMML